MTQWLRGLAAAHEIVVSTQVMIELRAVVTRKFKPALPQEDVRAALTALAMFDVIGTHAEMVLDAHELADIEQLSWFDALIVEAALRGHCDILYSEDFSHGRRFHGQLLVQNPLLDA